MSFEKSNKNFWIWIWIYLLTFSSYAVYEDYLDFYGNSKRRKVFFLEIKEQ